MRITQRMIEAGALRDIRARVAALARANEEVATGRRIRTMSDGPVDAARVMALDSQARDLEQFRRAGAWSATRMSAEDHALTTIERLLDEARGLAAAAATYPPGDPQRQVALTAIGQIRDEIVALGNTRVGDDFVFGGAAVGAPPFLADGTWVGSPVRRQAEIRDGRRLDVNHTGDALVPALQAVGDLITQLQTGDAAAVQTALLATDAARREVLDVHAELGAWQAEVKQTGLDLARELAARLDERDRLRDADPTESMVRLTSAQSALERAYAAVGKVLGTRLLDYLR